MIALVDYGAGNLRSVEFALQKIGAPWRRAGSPEKLAGAGAIVLPGVGAAASAMRELETCGLADALRSSDVPLLGICLGMQLVTESSEEGREEVECLGRVPGVTRRFGTDREVGAFPLPLPHIGWNDTSLEPDPLFEGLGDRQHFYFLHSYRVFTAAEFVIGEADYGGPFPAALRCGSRVAIQFHAEKSGPAGLRVLANFCRAAEIELRPTASVEAAIRW